MTLDTANTNVLTIKAWAEDDRPREKLLLKGRHTLTDAELLAILLGSGSRNETAVALAQRILNTVDNNLDELGKLPMAKFLTFRGIGEAKAITLQAAMELGRRRQASEPLQRKTITSSRDAFQLLAPLVQDLPHEECWVLLLNRANKIITQERVSIGGVSGTVIDAKLVFKKALEVLASGVIIIHNHPSGNPQPSEADKKITTQLMQAAKLLDMQVLDHLVIAANGTYYSFSDAGLL
ncbi:MAG: DNA repair protein RadC [Saprospiraceae bacterium]|nr:DNA repair protein RadC [Saprospiraceae bacterium]MBP7680118.1 DNA repair protein RadC [Saprospiraceae bacterium]